MLAHLQSLFGVHLVLEILFLKTQFVSYFTNIVLGVFHNFTSGKSRHYVLAN